MKNIVQLNKMSSKLLIALYVLATSFGLIVIKLGSKNGLPVSYTDNKLNFNINLSIVLGICLYIFSFALYIYLISKNDLGYIIPLTTALVYTVIVIGSFFIFHEVFTTLKIIGIVLILSGLVLLNLHK